MKPLLLVFFVLAKVLDLNCEVLDEYYRSNMFFTKELYKRQLSLLKHNFMISPASIQALFALVALNGQGDTENYFLTVAQLPINPSEVAAIYNNITEKLLYNKSESISAFSITNYNYQLIPEQKNILEYKYTTRFNTSYSNDQFETHFAKSYFAFSNGVTFRHEFNLNERWKTEFYVAPMKRFDIGNNVKYPPIKMINAREILNYHYDKLLRVEFLEIPITDKELTLTIVLPKDLDRLLHVEESIFFYLRRPPYQELNISVTIPNDFGEGYLDIFNTLLASDLYPLPTIDKEFAINGNGFLKIRGGFSKAHLDVSLALGNGQHYPQRGNVSVIPQEKHIMVNRPFFYYIKHSVMGVVLIGRFIKPIVAS